MLYGLVVSSPANLSSAKRWALVNRCVAEQDARAALDRKFQQTAALMASVKDFGWTEALAEGDEEVRQMWTKLRSVNGDGHHSR